MSLKIRFKRQVTAIPGFHSLYNCCYQTRWLFSGAPEDPEDETMMEKHGIKALNGAVMCLTHTIRSEDEDIQHLAAHWMIQIAKPWAIKR